MRFFSKITFICNLCFVAFTILHLLEKKRDAVGNKDAIIPLPAVEGTLAVLGLASVIINFIFAILCLLLFILKKQIPVAKWLVWVNLLFLILQFIYFKLY